MDDQTRILTVTPDGAGDRLDRWLAATLGKSRSAVQRLIKDGLVTVDDRNPIPHQIVREGQSVTVRFPEMVRRHETLAPKIVAAAADYVVVDKPSGLLVHPTPRGGETTLVDWLMERYPAVASVGDPQRPGIVHRIDREVSGLLVVALTQAMFDHLGSEFRDRRVEKSYSALVLGDLADDGVIRFPIARSRRRRGRMAARPAHEEGKEAVTRYVVQERFGRATLLTITIETGRTHQIRAHCFAIGHPIIGDRLYRAKSPVNLPPLDRPFLHATDLAFTDREGALQRFHAGLPEELMAVLSAVCNPKRTGGWE